VRSQVVVLEEQAGMMRRLSPWMSLTLEDLLAEAGLLDKVHAGLCLVVVNGRTVPTERLRSVRVTRDDSVIVVPILCGG